MRLSMVLLAGYRSLISVLMSSVMFWKMLQSLNVIEAISLMCSSCNFKKTESSMPNVRRRMMICRLRKPDLYLFQSRISRYYLASGSKHLYLIMLGLNWMVFSGSCGFNTSTPLAPWYRIWITLSFLRDSLRLISSSKFSEILPIPSVYMYWFWEYSSGIYLHWISLALKVQDAEKLCPILAALLAGFSMKSNDPKKDKIWLLFSLWIGPLSSSNSCTYQREDDRSCEGDQPRGIYYRSRILMLFIWFLKSILVIYFWFFRSLELYSWIATLRKN